VILRGNPARARSEILRVGSVHSTFGLSSSGAIMNQPEIARRRQNRADLLVRLYEIVDASVTTFVNGLEIAEALGIDREEATRIIEYLQEKQFIHIDDHKLGIIRITALGIDHVETAG
jgi:CRP-like cAMP-binding protein